MRKNDKQTPPVKKEINTVTNKGLKQAIREAKELVVKNNQLEHKRFKKGTHTIVRVDDKTRVISKIDDKEKDRTDRFSVRSRFGFEETNETI